MITNFNYCVFSIFCIEDFNKILDAIKIIYKSELKEKKADIYNNIFDIDKFINPPSGGKHLPRFCCWKNEFYKDKIFFISNYEDGLINLCKQIQIKLECNLIMCAMSNNLTYPKYMFYYLNQSENERLIQVYKEDKWIFYEKGYALPFENVNFYKKRQNRERLNNEIIYYYLNKNGIDFESIDKKVITFFEFARKHW